MRWGDDASAEGLSFERLPAGPHRLPRELVRENQRQRILIAALDVFSDRSYADASVKDLIGRAHVSRTTFYEIFEDKEACLVALYEEVVSRLWREGAAAAAERSEWRARLRAAVERTMELLAEDPRLAAVCMAASGAGVGEARARHAQAVDEVGSALRTGRAECPHGESLPEILETALVSGAVYLVGRSIVCGQGPAPEVLADELSRLLLVPYEA